MGDMGEIFQSMTIWKKNKKKERLEQATDKLLEAGFEKITDYHFRRLCRDGRFIDYWPSTLKYRHGSKMGAAGVDFVIKYSIGEQDECKRKDS